MNKYLVLIPMVLLSFGCSKAQKIPFFPLQNTVIHYKGIIIRNPIDDSPSDTIHWNFTTTFTPVYLSENLKVIRCVNLPLLANFDIFDYENGKMHEGNFDTTFVAIQHDSIFYVSDYTNRDTIQSNVKKLLVEKITQTEFIAQFRYLFLNLININDIIYQNPYPDYNCSYTVKKVSENFYEISEKTHNYDVHYWLSYHEGLYKVDYHWGRIVDYEIILEQVE